MLPSVTGFDHFIVLVRDIDRAAAQYRALGFQLTERGHHTLGTSNHTIMLEGNYVELLGVEHPGPANAGFRARLAAHEGPGGVALQTADGDAVRRELAALGLDAPPPVAFSRPVRLAGGSRDARFRIARFPDGTPPGLPLFACEHLTREVVWRPEWQRHPNGARRIDALTLVHPDPALLMPDYARLFGEAALSHDGDGFTLHLAATPVRFLSPGAFARRFPGIDRPAGAGECWLAGATIAVGSLAETAALLDAGSIRTLRTPGNGLVADPARAAGAVIEFRAA